MPFKRIAVTKGGVLTGDYVSKGAGCVCEDIQGEGEMQLMPQTNNERTINYLLARLIEMRMPFLTASFLILFVESINTCRAVVMMLRCKLTRDRLMTEHLMLCQL